jgi:hypothetical protein
MIDMNANMTPMTIQMPADLIAEIRRVAGRTGMTVDELVQEACAQFVEPYEWDDVSPQRIRTDTPESLPAPNGTANTPSAHS